MKIQELLNYLEGKWLAQQTTFNVDSKKSISYKSEVLYHNSTLKNSFLIQKYNKSELSSLEILFIPTYSNCDSVQNTIFFISNHYPANYQGRFIKWTKGKPLSTLKGNFKWKATNFLNLTIKNKGTYIHEKIYITGENLRLSSTIIKKYGVCVSVGFLSEIKLVKKELSN